MHRILLLAALLAGFAFGQTPQTFDRINTRTQNAIEFADQYPGPDAFAKINAAIAALPPTGGTVDARGFAATPQPVSTPLVIGSATKPVVLMMDGNTEYQISTTGGVDAIQLWSKSSLICLNQTNATSATFALTKMASVNTILSSYPRSPAGNLTYQQGCSFKGNSGATVSSALVELYNATDITGVRNELIWNFFGAGLKISINQGSGGSGPINLENLSVNGFGNPGAVPVLLQWNKGGGVMGDINFLGGSFTHPGPGGLPIIDLEGGSAAGIDGVNFYGAQFESANRDDIGILIDNTRDVFISGPLFTSSGSKPGADCVKIAQSGAYSLGVVITNLINFNSWTRSINDTVNHITDTRARVVGYTMASADNVLQSWVGAVTKTGRIADITVAGLNLNKPLNLVEGSAPAAGTANQDVCYGDLSAHALKCSYNNGAFLQVAQVLSGISAPVATPTTTGTCTQQTTAVSGASPGMSVVASPTSPPPPGTVWSAWVSSPGKVSLNECAVTPGTGGSMSFTLRVIP